MRHSPKGVTIHPDFDALVKATAARLVTKLVDVQSRRGEATVVLTGGSAGTAAVDAGTRGRPSAGASGMASEPPRNFVRVPR